MITKTTPTITYSFNSPRLQPHSICSYAQINWYGRRPTRCGSSVPRRPTSLLEQEPSVSKRLL